MRLVQTRELRAPGHATRAEDSADHVRSFLYAGHNELELVSFSFQLLLDGLRGTLYTEIHDLYSLLQLSIPSCSISRLQRALPAVPEKRA